MNKSTWIGLPGILFVVFLILKLCGVISWSWWWVTAPLWIPTSLLLAIIAFCLVMHVIQKITR